MRVLLDANALMMPVELDVRVFDELDRLLGGIDPSYDRQADGSVGALPDERNRSTTGAIEAATPSSARASAGGTTTTDDEIEADPAHGYAESGLDGIELVVPGAVLAELDSLAGPHGTEAIAASVGADLARDRCVFLPHEADYADDAVLELACDRRAGVEFVVTNDRELTERLLAHDVPVLCLRGHSQLTIREP